LYLIKEKAFSNPQSLPWDYIIGSVEGVPKTLILPCTLLWIRIKYTNNLWCVEQNKSSNPIMGITIIITNKIIGEKEKNIIKLLIQVSQNDLFWRREQLSVPLSNMKYLLQRNSPKKLQQLALILILPFVWISSRDQNIQFNKYFPRWWINLQSLELLPKEFSINPNFWLTSQS
jgi:hypothetical protein